MIRQNPFMVVISNSYRNLVSCFIGIVNDICFALLSVDGIGGTVLVPKVEIIVQTG